MGEVFYDDATFSGENAGQVLKGDLTMSWEWIDPPDPAARIASVRYQFDDFGNAVAILDPLAVAAGSKVDPARGHVRTVTCDDQFHSFPGRRDSTVTPPSIPTTRSRG